MANLFESIVEMHKSKIIGTEMHKHLIKKVEEGKLEEERKRE
jgi:hypothetical protein